MYKLQSFFIYLYLFTFICLIIFQTTNCAVIPSSFTFSFPDGTIGDIGVPWAFDVAKKAPKIGAIKVSHSFMKEFFPTYSIRVATNGIPHYP